jgi:FeS assembly SUF system protein
MYPGMFPPPIPSEVEDLEATAGSKLPEGVPPATEEQVIEALKDVHDPEIPVNIYDLGLIYELEIKDDGDVNIEMTLTAPACPVAGEMPGDVAEAAAKVDGVGVVNVKLTWDPPWTPERMSEVAQVALDMF